MKAMILLLVTMSAYAYADVTAESEYLGPDSYTILSKGNPAGDVLRIAQESCADHGNGQHVEFDVVDFNIAASQTILRGICKLFPASQMSLQNKLAEESTTDEESTQDKAKVINRDSDRPPFTDWGDTEGANSNTDEKLFNFRDGGGSGAN